jgi:hypothetical protein
VLPFVKELYVKGIILQVSQLTWFNALAFLFGEESMWKRKSWMHNSWQIGDLLINEIDSGLNNNNEIDSGLNNNNEIDSGLNNNIFLCPPLS